MRAPIALLLLVLGCGGRPAPEPASAEEIARTIEPSRTIDPPLVWEPGSDRVRARGVGVEFRVRAPIVRFAPDELGTAACGDRMLHATIVDRRTRDPSSEAVLARAFARAGCEAPRQGEILDAILMAEGATMRVRFDDTDMRGEWTLRSVILPRGHRRVVIVSAIRVPPGTDAAPLFEMMSEAPRLTGIGDPADPDATIEDQRLREAVDVVLGVMEVAAPLVAPAAERPGGLFGTVR